MLRGIVAPSNFLFGGILTKAVQQGEDLLQLAINFPNL
jgi:hypothetical protein